MLVQENIAEKMVQKIKDRMGHLRVGDSLDKCIDVGAIVDPQQRKSVDDLVQKAREERAEVGVVTFLNA